MREETRQLVDESIYYALINPINDSGLEQFTGGEKIDPKKHSKYVYQNLIELSEFDSMYTKAIRFDGKKNIMSQIEKRIVELFEQEKMQEMLSTH